MKHFSCEELHHELREADIQSIFDNWGSDETTWLMAGIPKWLSQLGRPINRKQYWAKTYADYRYIPDAIWKGSTCYVLEIKHGAKEQALAIPEVLHHIWWIKSELQLQSMPIPIILVSGQYDGTWTRGAINALHLLGLPKNSLQYLEASYYQIGDLGCKIAWFEVPFNDTVNSKPPFIPHGKWSSPEISWIKETDSDNWLGTQSPHDDYSTIPPEHCKIARLRNRSSFLVYMQNYSDSTIDLYDLDSTV